MAALTVHVVPVFEGALVAFDVDAPEARGRWLPWTPLAHGGNPWETASAVMDEWCDGAVADLRLVDVIARREEEGGEWGLAIVFRAELTAFPRGERGRPHSCAPPEHTRVRGFAAVDLARWLAMRPDGGATPPGAPPLVF